MAKPMKLGNIILRHTDNHRAKDNDLFINQHPAINDGAMIADNKDRVLFGLLHLCLSPGARVVVAHHKLPPAPSIRVVALHPFSA